MRVKNYTPYILLTALCMLFMHSTFAQPVTLMSTGTCSGGSSTSTGNCESFSVRNNSGGPIVIREIHNYHYASPTGAGTYDLWYTTVSGQVTGGTATISTPNWIQAAAGVSVGGANGVKPFFTGLSIILQPGQIGRFAIVFPYTVGSSTIFRPSNTIGSQIYTSAGGVDLLAGSANGVSNALLGSGLTLNSTWSFLGGIVYEIALKGMNNASVYKITSPVNFCQGTYPVVVSVKNSGKNKINNVKIYWLLDGVPQTPINWTTPIDTFGSVGGNEALVTLGNVTWGATPHTFKIYTSLPNGVADTVNNDDTINVTKGAALNGVYTVGGAAPDYPTLSSAITALNSWGICGPVTFNLRPITHTGNVAINTISGASATNRVTIQAENGNAASTVVSYSATGSADNFVMSLNGASYLTIKNLTLSATGSSYGYVMPMSGTVSNDSILNCNFLTSNAASSSFGCIYASGVSGNNDNMVFRKNLFSGGYYGGLYWGGNSASYAAGMVIDSNTINNLYYYGLYVYYTNGVKIRDNNITGSTTSYYPFYIPYCYQSPIITGNRVESQYGYGMYILYAQGLSTSNKGLIANNKYVGKGTTTLYYGLYANYPNNTRIYNNTAFVYNNYSSCYAFEAYMSGYSGNDIKNNLGINTGGGTGAYLYSAGTSASNPSDYNNWYSNSTSAPFVYNGTTYTSFNAFRGAYGDDKNTLSYDPGLKFDGTPNPLDPGVWAVNGRGVQIAGNAADIDGNPRPTLEANGVPDLGAIETVPQCEPPLAVPVNPPVVGAKQYFTFGFDTVAAINWNATLGLTAPLEVRQYSGAKAPGFNLISPTKFMYFYTDVRPMSGLTTFDYNAEIYYKDPWRGTMPTEANIKLAELMNGTWYAYNGSNSAANTTRNFLSGPGLARFGAFTGIDDGTIFSAIIKAKGSTVICYGSNVTLKSNTGAGYTYQWNKNGAPIAGANEDSLVVNTAGDYSVTVTSSQGTATSVSINVSTIAPPMAQITASGALTYCPGSNLTLNANTGAGLAYQWQLGGLDIAGATGSSYTVTSAGTYTVRVKNIGCATTSNATAVSPGPLAISLGNDTAFCQSKYKPFVLDAGITGAKYQWSTGDTTQKINVYTTSGDYWVIVDAGVNCVDADTVHLSVSPLPSVNAINALPVGTNTWAFSPAGPKNVNNVLWIFPDGTSNNTNTQHTFPDGNVVVKLVMYNDCGSDTTMLIRWATNVNTTTNEGFDVKLYPNPAKEKVMLTLEGNVYLKDVTILNSVGAVVYRNEVSGTATKQAVIDITPYASGQYIIRANTSEGPVNKALNIVR